jgi:hypothetical protein
VKEKIKPTKLHNGTIVKEGDTIQFVNSDGELCEEKIMARKYPTRSGRTSKIFKKGTLFFWNACFEPKDYPSAVKVESPPSEDK